jgi:hypothetical protein
MRKRKQFRQGDVLLVEVLSIPANARRVASKKRAVLAEGEVTGHAHVLRAAEVEEYAVTDTEERFYRIMAANGMVGLLTHEEHSTLEIPPGDYQLVRQREYSPEEIRRVSD